MHDAESINRMTRSFLEALGVDYILRDDFSDFGTADLSLILCAQAAPRDSFASFCPCSWRRTAVVRSICWHRRTTTRWRHHWRFSPSCDSRV